MEGLDTDTIIAVCSILAILFTAMFFVITASISPLKKDIAKLEKRMDGLEAGQAEIKELISSMIAEKKRV